MLPANPYDLHEIIFNGHKVLARPVEWNSQMVDQIKMKNHFGDSVLASKIVLTCPDCSAFKEIYVHDDLNTNYKCECSIELAKSVKTLDPFVNPFEANAQLYSSLCPSIENKQPAIKKLPKKTTPKTCSKNLSPKDGSAEKNINRSRAKSDEDNLMDLASKPFDDADLLE
jgi:hypothetical protein